MKYIQLAILILCISTLMSCDSKSINSNEKQASIEINFEGINYSSIVYLSHTGPEKTSTIDSAIVENSKMVNFTVNLQQSPDIYTLWFSSDESIRLVLEEGENAIININGSPILSNYNINGSPASQLTLDYALLLLKHTNIHDSAYTHYRSAQGKENIALVRATTDSTLKHNYKNTYNSVREMLVANPNSLASLLGIYSKFGNSTVLDFDYDYDVFKLLSDSLIMKYPNNSHVISLNNKVNNKEEKNKLTELRYSNLDKGNKFPNISLKSIDNILCSINSDTNKLRIVYLWRPNTKSFYGFNKVLRKISKNYSKEELEIVSIAFEKDKLIWNNLCRMERMTDWQNLIADASTEDLINPKQNYSLVYILGENNEILLRTSQIDDLKDIRNYFQK